MDNSLFFCDIEENDSTARIISLLQTFSSKNAIPIYIISAPLGFETSSQYHYSEAFAVLVPKHKICFINCNASANATFDDYCDDFIEDLGYLSEKYDYRSHLGRPRTWRDALTKKLVSSEIDCAESIMTSCLIEDEISQRNADFLISLLIGSINDISRIGGNYPETILDQVKKKIILFDGDQSRFIYSQITAKKRVTIQGLAGTGKTELLLHKLKDLYVKYKDAKIVFTCYNKTLAKSMEKRVPDFFNFMRVDEQIKWRERLWVMSSWGSRGQQNSGVYSYICSHYGIGFHSFSYTWQFDTVCKTAIDELREIGQFEPCFDYILIDESQDFPQSFFELCELVTKNNVYVAGDIFQDIYDRTINQSVQSDYLLNKCYRTDPKTLMFAHAVGMGLYEIPVIRWLEDDEWLSCGYKINRTDTKFVLSRVPLRRFEDIDTSQVNSIEVLSSSESEIQSNVLSIIDSIRAKHSTVQAGDIAIVFLEGSNRQNYELADYLSFAIPKKYSWKVVKGYETKDRPEDALFISNRNNIKGLEFPFVICIIRGHITDNVFARNTIYMMLTRSFITSYFLINDINTDFISTYSDAAREISVSGVMALREPSLAEKKQQNQKVSIAVAKKQRTVKEIIEEVFKEYPSLTAKNKKRVSEAMMEFIGEEGSMDEGEIQERTRKMIAAYI